MIIFEKGKFLLGEVVQFVDFAVMKRKGMEAKLAIRVKL